jgi:protein-disulfide isomerase
MSMTTALRACVLAAGAAALAGCTNVESAQQAPAQGTGDASQVVATIGDKSFTLKDVESKWQQDDPAERARVTQLLYQYRRQSVDQLIGDYLVSEAAKKSGTTKEKYLEAELSKRRGEITEAQIQEVYDQNRDRVGTSTVNDLRDSIRTFITRNRDGQNLAILVGELKKTAPPVHLSLEPPRTEVAIAKHDPVRGPDNAPVTIIEFSEYQCPFCGRVTPTLHQLQQKYGDKIRIVFKDFPLPNHLQAPKAAEAAHCAGDQGKYWELHDRLFANQQQIQVADLKKHAAAVGLDQAKFDQCLDSGTYTTIVQEDVDLGGQMGVQSTPTLYINGRVVTGAQPIGVFEAIIDEELARKGTK